MTEESGMAMATWLGALAKGGIVDSTHAEAGTAVASYVVGEEALDGLRKWFAEQSDEVVLREKRAAIRICIHMANADRDLDPEESHLLQKVIMESRLDDDTVDQLVTEVHAPPSIDGIADELTQPTLRELMLALSWELASADGRIDDEEKSFYEELRTALDVPEARAKELQEALTLRLTAPPS